jgi:hypothetical protein
MKVDKDTLVRITDAIAPLDTPELRQRYRDGDFPRADATRDLDMRYRWDLFWKAGGYRLLPSENGLDSSHIDTALRRVVAGLDN